MNGSGGIRNFLCASLVILFAFSLHSESKIVFKHRYAEIGFDFRLRKNRIEKAYHYMDRCAAAGYNGVWVANHFQDLHLDKGKQKGIAKFKEMLAYAKSKGLYPAPMNIHQMDPRMVDSSLAAALPVKGTPFTVKGNEATVVTDPAVAFKNPGFEELVDGRPAHWKITGDVTDVSLDNGALLFDNPSEPTWITQKVDNLKPWRAYMVSLEIKTQQFSRSSRLMVKSFGTNGRYLLTPRGGCFGRWGIGQTTRFTRYTVDFNSQTATSAKIRLVVLDGGVAASSGTGKVWFDNVTIKEVGLYETVRRSSLPYKVTSDDGKTVYEEGKDFEFVLSNELLDADRRHPLGQKLLIPNGSRLKEGQQVRVDWWQHANMQNPQFAPTAFCTQRAWDVVDKTIQNADEVFGSLGGLEAQGSRAWMCTFDEWRAGFWDAACQAIYKNAGEYGGNVMRGVSDCLKKSNTNRLVFVHSNMYDPYQGANRLSTNHFMVNGNWWGSWNYVPKDVVMVKWWQYAPSHRAFAGLDPKYPELKFRQVFGLFDDSRGYKLVENSLQEFEANGIGNEHILGVAFLTGIMYLPDYPFEQLADYWKSVGRWGTNSLEEVLEAPAIKSKLPVAPTPRLNLTVRASGVLEYRLKRNADIRLGLYNLQGQKVLLLASGMRKRGTYEVNLKPSGLAAGVYFARLQLGDDEGSERRESVAKTVLF